MNIVTLIQGSNEWHQFRRDHYPASEAPAVMGCSRFDPKTPEALAKVRLGLVKKEVSDYQQRLFDEGHAMEHAALTLVEQHLLDGEPLSPMVGISDDDYGLRKKLSASFDGIDMSEKIIFEHKMWNHAVAEMVKTGNLSDAYAWQLDHQLLVSGGEKVILVTSDSRKFNQLDYELMKDEFKLASMPFTDPDTGEVCVYAAREFEYCEYRPDPERFERLIEGWRNYEQIESSLIETDSHFAEVSKIYAGLLTAIKELEAKRKEYEKIAKPYRDELIRHAKNVGRSALVGDFLEMKSVERKGGIDEKKLGELLSDEQIESCRKPASVTWRIELRSDQSTSGEQLPLPSEVAKEIHGGSEEDVSDQASRSRSAKVIPGVLSF